MVNKFKLIAVHYSGHTCCRWMRVDLKMAQRPVENQDWATGQVGLRAIRPTVGRELRTCF